MEQIQQAPRAALFHDLSGLGRCALTVAMPVLAAMGAQPCPLPTALLSAHTGYEGAVLFDASDFLRRGVAHWRARGETFNGVYSGYLSSPAQALLLAEYFSELREGGTSLLLIDPAMADHGRLYQSVSADMPKAMKALCKTATLVTPNLTEACLLTDRPYDDAPRAARDIRDLLSRLLDLGCDAALITGVPLLDGRFANAMLCARTDKLLYCPYRPLPRAYPGTGDLLASLIFGGLLHGDAAQTSLARATAFTHRAIERALFLGQPAREGVPFEPMLQTLFQEVAYPIETEE